MATAAALNSPWGVAVDGSGNVFIADTSNNRVRKVDHSTGVITTVAGDGTAAYGGDNGPAIAASLNRPWAVAVDTIGHLYISDRSNNRIRRVDLSTGMITTVAGNGSNGYSGDDGPATSASIGGPGGITLDASGGLFIADTDNSRVRRVDVSTGVITTIAGGGAGGDNGPAIAASLRQPSGVAVDTSGHLFIADQVNQRIREVNLITGVITTIVGDGIAAFFGDNGVAAAAEINNSYGIAVDSQGNLFIADSSNNRIRQVKPGFFVTVAQSVSNIAVTASDSSSAYGQSVAFIAKVTPSNGVAPTGTVQFQVDGHNVGSPIALTDGAATYSTSTLTVGNHVIVAIYSGDANLTSGTSPTFSQSVGKATPTITWNSPAPITYGTALSSTQLNAAASVAGTYSYSPALGAVLHGGIQPLQLTFTPADMTAYTTATAVVNVNVTPALLTTSLTICDKTYDGSATATIISRSLRGVLGSDDVTLAGGTAVFVDKNAGAGKKVTVTGLHLSGVDAVNYTASTADTVSANIIPVLLTVTAEDKTRRYGAHHPVADLHCFRVHKRREPGNQRCKWQSLPNLLCNNYQSCRRLRDHGIAGHSGGAEL